MLINFFVLFMIRRKTVLFVLTALILLCQLAAFSQACTTLGQTPSTAFPVCGTSVFTQSTVPLCQTNNIFVPGCTNNSGAAYANKNPFFYKFFCYTSGTLGFVITPLAAREDYDWQLWDITGKNPEDIFTDNSLVVTGNWAGTYGNTGTSATGISGIGCASDPADNEPTFAKMPNIIAGHEYLLMVSHFTDGQSGYTLEFKGGTAVITDPTDPHLASVKPDCDGKTIRVKLNKRMKCSSLTASGSEFSIVSGSSVVSASAISCSSGFDFDELVITLTSPLANGNYELVINNGSDGNSLMDNCGREIPAGEKLSFFYAIPQPIFADSVGKVGCAPDSVKIYFPKRIACSSLAANGNDFTITGPQTVTVTSAYGNCVNGLSDYIVLKFASPVYTKGNYIINLTAGTDGSPILDECNIPLPTQQLSFTAADTVSAVFNYNIDYGCRTDTLHFSHNGAHDVHTWKWTFNNLITANTQSHTIDFPAASSNTVQLIVSNGVCSDTVVSTIVLDNEVKANFTMPPDICPEDALEIKNTSTGLIDNWQWSFDIAGTSTIKDPFPVQFPQNNIESYYLIKLKATNNTLGCSDSISKKVRVLNNCFIAVPTAFTPNNDGLNDYLYPNNAIKAENLQFNVYNRWGQLVFSSRDWQKKWDGKVNGIPQASGVYVWFLSYTHSETGQKVFQKGTTTLIR
jgi:gliding motility-associated-like protein